MIVDFRILAITFYKDPVCGIYPLEVAETKIIQVTSLARDNGFPLKSTMEAE